jgi:hypothetical protein
MCSFKIVYAFLPHGPTDLMHLPSSEKLNIDATQRAESMLNCMKPLKKI